MKRITKKGWMGIAGILLVVMASWYGWQAYNADGDNQNFVSSNGRIEATEVNVASKMAGRVDEILVNEGDLVEQGQVLAEMDMASVEAQLLQAKAQVANTLSAKETALAQVAQRKADVVMAKAVLVQRYSDLELANKTSTRTKALLAQDAISVQESDNTSAQVRNTQAMVNVAKAQIVTAEAGVRAALSQVTQAEAGIEADKAVVKRLESEIEDGILRAPRGGRVQFRVVQPGEVVSNGGNVLSLVDLNDVYMTFFLPSALAGQIPLGADVRLILDAAPDYPIPAKVSYVSSVAQFTPKMVETQSEREKLVFRVKARIDPKLLSKHIEQVKTGLPGMAHVRLNPSQPWPAKFEAKQP